MRLSELRGVLNVLEYYSQRKGNVDPIIELYNIDDVEGNASQTINLEAIHNDPEGQVTKDGTIQLPMKEIVTRGYVIVYGTAKGEDCIIIQAESKAHAETLFRKHFSTYTLKTVSAEI